MMEPSTQIVAGGGVVYRMVEGIVQVLVIRRRGVWDLPKGKIEPGESIKNGAVREVQEETGCRDVQVTHDLGSTIHFYREKGEQVRKQTWWYAMQCNHDGLKPQLEEEIEEVTWAVLDEAMDQVHFDNLKEVLSRFDTAVQG